MCNAVSDEDAVRIMAATIRWNARRLGRAVGVVDDLEQEGRLGAVEAARRFDPANGVKFRSYALRRVVGRMLDFLRYDVSHLTRHQLAAGMSIKVLSISLKRGEYGTLADTITIDDTTREVDDGDEAEAVVRLARKSLPPSARLAVFSMFGVGGPRLNEEQVCERLKVPTWAVQELRERGMRLLRERVGVESGSTSATPPALAHRADPGT